MTVDTPFPTKVIPVLLWAAMCVVLSGAPPTSPTPYAAVPQLPAGTVLPWQYDKGGEGVAYHDADVKNQGNEIRLTEGVDLETATCCGYDIGWTQDGEWINFTVNVTKAGKYAVRVKVASPLSDGRLHATVGKAASPIVPVPATGGWQNWMTVDLPITVVTGKQNLRLFIDTGGLNIGTMDLVVPGTPLPVPDPVPIPPPTPTPTPPPPSSPFAVALPPVLPPSTGTVRPVGTGADLQAAINAAVPGDTILLAAGATYTGNFVLPNKSGNGTITISTNTTAIPANTRVTPAHAVAMAKISSGNTWTAIATAPGAHHYVLNKIEVLPNGNGVGEAISLGDGSDAQNTLSMVPHDLVLDQVYVHGSDATGQKRCIGLNSASTTIKNSRIENCWQAGQDSQAIGGWNGPGPYLIDNNYLEAASENFLLGGSDPAIKDLLPSDITFTHNLVTKRLAWRNLTDRNVKNLFELKAGRRLRVEGNVFENNWVQAQSGYAIVLTGRSQDGRATWNVVQDFLFTNNIVRHVASAINILGHDYYFESGMSHNLLFINNLFEDVNGSTWGGDGRLVLVNNGYDYRFDHNTVLQNGNSVVYAADNPVQRFVFTNNIAPNGEYGIMGGGTGPGNSTITTWLPGASFLQNVFAANPYAYLFPSNNFYPATMVDAGFMNLSGGNYRLATTSPYKGKGTDGKDLGANIDAINTAAGTSY